MRANLVQRLTNEIEDLESTLRDRREMLEEANALQEYAARKADPIDRESDQLMTTAEIAELVGVSQPAVLNRMNTGALPFINKAVGGRILRHALRGDVERLWCIEQPQEKPTPTPMQQGGLLSEPMYTIKQVANMLGLSKSTVHRHARTGLLKSVRFGRSYRVGHSAIQSWVQENRPVPQGL